MGLFVGFTVILAVGVDVTLLVGHTLGRYPPFWPARLGDPGTE